MKAHKLLLSLTIICFALFASPKDVAAQANGNGGDLGVGVMLGEPTGITVKSWNNNRSAFSVGAAWSFSGSNENIHLQGDYLLHNWFNEIEGGPLAFYYGLGARTLLGDNSKIGVRVPLGLNYVIPNSQLDAFIELAPTLDIIPDTEFTGSGNIGIRYYF